MDNHRDITTANAISILTVDDLFPNGIVLEQYATDQSIGMDNSQITETRMGVDGKMVAGFTPNIKVVTISLEASSPSVVYFNQLADAMETYRKIYLCHLQCEVPSIYSLYRWKNGVLQTATIMPPHKKVLDPTSWVFHFESFERSSL
jgi:hypothetical protein